MWRVTMFMLCLIAALSGTLLRQAEAASDFVRSFGELGQGHLIETIDGGVGDDAEASILKAGEDAYSLAATILRPVAAVHFTPSIPASALPDIGDRRQAELLDRLLASSERRFAWLQCFLF